MGYVISLGGLNPSTWTNARAGYLDNINNAQLALITATHIANFDALTAARAGYLDNINNAQLALITATHISNFDALTVARAAKLDNLDVASSTLAPSATALSTATWTATKAGYLDVSVNSRAPSATALSTATWTNARAGYLDNINNAQLANITAAHISNFGNISTINTYVDKLLNPDQDVDAVGAGTYLVTSVSSGNPDTYGNWTELEDSTSEAVLITGVFVGIPSVSGGIGNSMIQIGTGAAASETAHLTVHLGAWVEAIDRIFIPFAKPYEVSSSTRIAARIIDNKNSETYTVSLQTVDTT